jgi:peptidyl-prolyl cis-trans isomerase B (cyclophilin B)
MGAYAAPPMRLPRCLVPLLALAALAGCGSSSKSKAKPGGRAKPAAATAAASTPAAPGCQKVAAPKSKGAGHLSRPTLKLDPKKSYTATVKTSCGDFSIKLDVKRAPKTAASFVYLARKHFFDRTSFHRVVPGFVIQGGDPLGNGTGGPGYSVIEAPPSGLKYTTGVVAMAKGGSEPAGASGSQFFVVTGPDAGLPPDYALLGKVTKGLDVVQTIGTVPTVQTTEAPVSPVAIDSVTIQTG